MPLKRSKNPLKSDSEAHSCRQFWQGACRHDYLGKETPSATFYFLLSLHSSRVTKNSLDASDRTCFFSSCVWGLLGKNTGRKSYVLRWKRQKALWISSAISQDPRIPCNWRHPEMRTKCRNSKDPYSSRLQLFGALYSSLTPLI